MWVLHPFARAWCHPKLPNADAPSKKRPRVPVLFHPNHLSTYWIPATRVATLFSAPFQCHPTSHMTAEKLIPMCLQTRVFLPDSLLTLVAAEPLFIQRFQAEQSFPNATKTAIEPFCISRWFPMFHRSLQSHPKYGKSATVLGRTFEQRPNLTESLRKHDMDPLKLLR